MKKSIERKRCEDLLTDKDEVLLKQMAREYFADITAYYSKIMGIKYNRVTITSAKRRWGSCSAKGNICYSFRLMLYPESAREYVVVHELAHILEMNHSDRFYKIIQKYLPDYKERRKILKEAPH